MYLLPVIKVHADGTEVSGQSQASAWELLLLFQDPTAAGRAVLCHWTYWKMGRGVVRAKGLRLRVSEEWVQLGIEGEGLLLLFENQAL